MNIEEKAKEMAIKYVEDTEKVAEKGLGHYEKEAMRQDYGYGYRDALVNSKEEFLKLIEESEGDMDFLKFKLKNV